MKQIKFYIIREKYSSMSYLYKKLKSKPMYICGYWTSKIFGVRYGSLVKQDEKYIVTIKRLK